MFRVDSGPVACQGWSSVKCPQIAVSNTTHESKGVNIRKEREGKFWTVEQNGRGRKENRKEKGF